MHAAGEATDRVSVLGTGIVLATAVAFTLLPYSRITTGLLYCGGTAVSLTMASVGLLRARRHGTPAGTAAAIVAALGAFLVAEILWLAITATDPDPFPTVADAVFLLGYLPLALAAWLQTRTRRSASDRTVWLDVAILTLAAASVVWKVVQEPIAEDPSIGRLARSVALAYPVMDLVVLGLVLRLATSRATRTRAGMAFVVGATLVTAGDLVFRWMQGRDPSWSGTWIDGSWLVGYLGLALAALHQNQPPPGGHPRDRQLGGWWLAGVFAAVVVPYAIIIHDLRGMGGANAVSARVTAAGGAVLSALITARLWNLARSRQQTTDAERARWTLEAALADTARRDELTGLPNRAGFNERLRQSLTHGHAGASSFTAVMLVNLDDLNVVNDALGHDAGDTLIRRAARRLTDCVQPDVVVSRFVGDEFAVLLVPPNRAQATLLGERMLEVLRQPIEIDGREINPGASIGISFASPQSTVEALLNEASLAVREAKSLGKGRVVTHGGDAEVDSRRELDLRLDLLPGLANGEFRLDYQPIYAMDRSRLHGVEALLRWDHPSRGLVPPAQFVPAAEETGTILAIGGWVLETAIGQASAWNVSTSQPISLSVNASAIQLREPTFVGDVAAALDRARLGAEHLTIELTESILMDPEAILPTLQDLRAMGVGLAIDDFGTGYSSLAYLQQFPITSIKVDRAFVSQLARGRDFGIVSAILELARSSSLISVAEGIENATQLDLLASLGCDLAQGYYLGRPQTPDEITTLLARSDRRG